MVDGFTGIHQFLSMARGNFDLTGRAKFGGVPKRVVKVGNGFKMLWFEEIRPQDKKFILALLGFFLLDQGITSHGVHVSGHGCGITCVGAGHGKHFLGHGLNRFSSDTSAGRIIHAARGITVGFGNNGGLHEEGEVLEP